MATVDASVLASSPFKFVIDGNLLYIHAGLIALHSKPLHRMIEGPMSEAQQGYAELQDVDKGTFIRFMQWAYNGIYTASDFRIEPIIEPIPKPGMKHKKGKKDKKGIKASNVAVQITNELVDEAPSDTEIYPVIEEVPEPSEFTSAPPGIIWGFGSPLVSQHLSGTATKQSPTTHEVRFWSESTARELGIDVDESPMKGSSHQTKHMNSLFHNRNHEAPIQKPRTNEGPLEDYSEVFLSHARVYVFADKYDIEPLRKLTLKNLYQTLDSFTLYPERCRDVVALFKYSYTHTADRGERVEGLRKLLTLYMGYEMTTLAGNIDFKNLLLEDDGAVLGDFLSMVIKNAR